MTKAVQISCAIVKPDGVGKKVIGKIIERFESEGFQLMAIRLVRPTRELMEGFYAEHAGKPFFPAFLRFVTAGPLVVMAWQGEDAVARIRKIIGATNVKEAAPGTLRNKWGTDQRRNLIHASDSLPSAARELAFFFNPDELVPYDPDNWQAIERVVETSN